MDSTTVNRRDWRIRGCARCNAAAGLIHAPTGVTVSVAGDRVNDAPALAEVGIARGRALSRATMRNIPQNLVLASTRLVGFPIAVGVLYSALRLLLSPIIAAAAMSLSSVPVIGNALRLRAARI